MRNDLSNWKETLKLIHPKSSELVIELFIEKLLTQAVEKERKRILELVNKNKTDSANLFCVAISVEEIKLIINDKK